MLIMYWLSIVVCNGYCISYPSYNPYKHGYILYILDINSHYGYFPIVILWLFTMVILLFSLLVIQYDYILWLYTGYQTIVTHYNYYRGCNQLYIPLVMHYGY